MSDTLSEVKDHLARVENKVDKLSDAVVTLARLEERMLTLFSHVDGCKADLQVVEARISKLELDASANWQSLRFTERVFWIIGTAAVGLIFSQLRSGG
jgi:hypothetical protein